MHWSILNPFLRYESCTLYEIYPQSETPHLTQIAHIDFDKEEDRPSTLFFSLLPGTMIWHNFYGDGIVFRIWDYRLNHSINFSVDIHVIALEHDIKVISFLSKR